MLLLQFYHKALLINFTCTKWKSIFTGCRHGLAQWAVNMFQGELFGYANYIHLKKMIPAGVNFFWEDVVCKYWKWAKKAGGLNGSSMKPALSVMHAKAHNWTCQVIKFTHVISQCVFIIVNCELYIFYYAGHMGWSLARWKCLLHW